MSKSRLLLLFLTVVVFFPAFFVFSDENSELALIKTFPPVAEKSEIVLTTGFDTPEDAARKLLPGYAVKANEGRNGTAALFYERTDPNAYPLWSFPLTNLVPNKHYVINVWVRAEGIKKAEGSGNIAAICVEYSKEGKWAGGFYGDVSTIGTDWQPISLSIKAPSEEFSNLHLTFYLAKKITGKIWYDDVEVRTAAFAPAILLTRPDRLSFFGDQGNFSLRTESGISKQVRMLATIANAGKSKDILLKQNSLDFFGNIGILEPGQVEITAKLADLETKTIVAEEKFQLNAYPQTTPPQNACIIDEYNRAVVNGQPFMPLGVYGFANEKNYQRLQDAGFNCLQLYNSLGLKGKTDLKDDTKNVLAGLDLIDQYGLKLIFSLKDQFAHREGPHKKWGGTEGIDAVSELAVKTIKDHPALMAWYVSDEEQRKEVPLVLGLRQLISRIDSWHPTWTLTYRYDDLPYYGISGDTIGVDPYPISEKNVEQSIKLVKTAMTAGNSTGLPVWVVPQIFNWGIYKTRDKPEEFANSHFPTLEEMRAMTLYAAMLGAKGFVFYSNFDICQRYEQVLPGSGIAEREWAKVVEMVKPVKELQPFILSTKKPLEITVASEPKDAVEVGALLDDQGNYRIIVIGTGGNAKGVFTLPEILTKLKSEPLQSKFGKTKSLGNGKYEFVTESVDSDILY
ncbi:MAG: hypothetical protein LBC02_06390 [Planctomycetaceae bacterium]|jgi:hypothetical protein|nr:hypothetical protein [Planctomycetaceae bacterium]